MKSDPGEDEDEEQEAHMDKEWHNFTPHLLIRRASLRNRRQLDAAGSISRGRDLIHASRMRTIAQKDRLGGKYNDPFSLESWQPARPLKVASGERGLVVGAPGGVAEEGEREEARRRQRAFSCILAGCGARASPRKCHAASIKRPRCATTGISIPEWSSPRKATCTSSP